MVGDNANMDASTDVFDTFLLLESLYNTIEPLLSLCLMYKIIDFMTSFLLSQIPKFDISHCFTLK